MASFGQRDGVEAVRRAADIVEVVGETVSLRRAGRSFVGLCPFHAEKTPSFHVDPAKQLYYCFGCQAGGDVFAFVRQIHGLEFPEALRHLAERYNVPLPERDPREAREGRKRQRLLAALAATQELFERALGAPIGEAARTYLARRGLGPEALKRYGLGLAPESWDGLTRRLREQGFSDAELVEAGVAVPRRGGGGIYDRFRGRVTFPIRDTAGRVVSFGGRALGEGEPKYLNGPETPAYDKSRTLFRFFEQSAALRKSGRAVIVEGYFDALSLDAAGVEGVVAVCGTAFGEGHARLLRRFVDGVVLVLDGDAAGRRAALKALEVLLAAGLGVRVAMPPAGLDPDDVARQEGEAGALALVESAMDLPAFLVEESRQRFDLSSLDERVKAAELTLGFVAALPSPVARDEAVLRVAAGLGIDDAAGREELRRAARRRERAFARRRAGSAKPRLTINESEATLIRFLLACAAEKREDARRMTTHIPPGVLGDTARRVIESWSETLDRGEEAELAAIAETLEPEGRALVLELAFREAPPPDERAAWGAVCRLREGDLARRLEEIQARLASSTDDPEEHDRLAMEKLMLAREREALARERGRPSP